MPTPKKPRHKRKVPRRTYVLDKYLSGELEGFHVVIGSMTGAEAIRLRSGEVTEGESIELVAAKVIEHDFDVEDIRDLDLPDLLAISQAWNAAIKDSALPPTPASS